MSVQLLRGAEPRFIPGGRVGCLCLHGLASSPQEVMWLGEHLAAAGATVYVPRLAGHGIHPDYLARSRWQDWYATALDGYHLLRRDCDQVFVLGLSMGGLLALLLAANEPVAGAVIMAAPLSLPQRIMHMTPYLRYAIRYVPADGKPGALSERIEQMQRERGEPITGRVTYHGQFTMNGLAELLALQREVGRRLSAITVPLLLMYSEGDQTVAIANAEVIGAGVSSQDVNRVRLTTSDHILTNDVEHERVFAEAAAFIKTHGASSQPES